MASAPNIGTIGWFDLTVPDAERIRGFYQAVVGWKASPVAMAGCSDFNMIPPGTDHPVAGICHARGDNAALPAQWLLYITVADVDASVARCIERGGRVLVAAKDLPGHGRMCVIQDPAGAVAALFAPADAAPP
jgi:predicted enzyme related to lactoylglutathione lyase